MATVYVEADVSEVYPLGHTTGEDLTDSFATVLRLFTDGSETSGTEDRPQKKRKLDNGNLIGSQPVENFDENKSALLASLTVNLVRTLMCILLCRPCTNPVVECSDALCRPGATKSSEWSSQCGGSISRIVQKNL
jgi:hypothetical protein